MDNLEQSESSHALWMEYSDRRILMPESTETDRLLWKTAFRAGFSESSKAVKNDTKSLLPQIRLQPEETKIVLLYAMRYCLGRSSYAVGEMCDLIRLKWFALSPDTQSLLIVDLRSEVKSDRPLGMKMDRRQWESLLEFMESSFKPQPTEKIND